MAPYFSCALRVERTLRAIPSVRIRVRVAMTMRCGNPIAPRRSGLKRR